MGCAREALLKQWMVVAWTHGLPGGYEQKEMDSGCILEIELTELAGKLQKGGRIRESQRPSAGFLF